jgi:hypothetical protein
VTLGGEEGEKEAPLKATRDSENDGNAPEEEEEEDAALPDLTASGATAAEEATFVPTDDARLDGASKDALAEEAEDDLPDEPADANDVPDEPENDENSPDEPEPEPAPKRGRAAAAKKEKKPTKAKKTEETDAAPVRSSRRALRAK